VPHNKLSQALATTTAIVREVALPSIPTFSKSPLWSQFTPPPLGRLILITLYVSAIVGLLTGGAIVSGAYYYESIAYRAGWISVTQIPFVYMLAGKRNLWTILSGVSAERLNYFHRLVGRVVFITVTIHMAFFVREWDLSDFIQTELSIMPMVKYGFGAYGILVWIVLTSVVPARWFCYEFFVVNHLASAGALLWAVWKHVPSYAMYNVWLAVAFVVFDRILRVSGVVWLNISHKRLGFKAEIETKQEDGMVRVVIRDVPMNWQPGQYIFLQLPTIRPFESHPFTIATIPKASNQRFGSNTPSDILLLIKPQSGFSSTLYEKAKQKQEVTAILDGPYGSPPSWQTFETLVLIATGTGLSFTLPILEQIAKAQGCVRQVYFYWIVRHVHDLDFLTDRVEELAAEAVKAGVKVTLEINVTCGDLKSKAPIIEENKSCCAPVVEEVKSCCAPVPVSSASSISEADEVVPSCCAPPSDPADPEQGANSACRCCSSFPRTANSASLCRCEFKFGRQTLSSMIVPAVENATGETAIALCANRVLSAEARNLVAGLCDERAVHKGSGAQGILLYTEGFI